MEVFAGEASCASVPDFRAVQPRRLCCVSCVFCPGHWSTKGSAGASTSSCPLFAGQEEEDEPDSVSVCQQQSCCPIPMPNPQQQSLACVCFVPAVDV